MADFQAVPLHRYRCARGYGPCRTGRTVPPCQHPTGRKGYGVATISGHSQSRVGSSAREMNETDLIFSFNNEEPELVTVGEVATGARKDAFVPADALVSRRFSHECLLLSLRYGFP